ncbi:pickpocket protein 28-like [Tribolium madens]|uniref:pickpocket protein 28-like n=1 Tax=Tribolium madens TaxID=41895 RepID=UPI001CF72EAA|nr:pickpocket protein 28-like [Tribolium madens]
MVFTALGIELSDDKYVSSLTIYFKSNDFITSVRNELYGPIDFVANFGGLLGLFTGFSILSLMEIIYFLSVRILCNKVLYRKWAGKDS